MTQAQKIAKEKFKKAIAYRTKTGVSLKEAFAHIYGKKVGVIKKKAAPKKKVAPKKKAAPKKKIASKKVAAIKIIEKGESKSTKAKATYQQVRTKKGTYKGLKKVGGLHNIGEIEASDFTRISNDVNGNPRYVIHFLQILNDQERLMPFNEKYEYALKKAKKMGGRKFSNKQYGGGIVFQSYNVFDLAQKLEKLKNI